MHANYIKDIQPLIDYGQFTEMILDGKRSQKLGLKHKTFHSL